MSIGTDFVAELEQELPITRRVLERVPGEQGQWKPHPKSFSLGHLALLVAGMPGWLTNAIRERELDLAKMPPYSYEPTEKLLRMFDSNVTEALGALRGAKDAEFGERWELKMAGRTLFGLPRAAVIRQDINHLVHHRGQLTVYLRLIDVPVPSIYGPSADEKMF